MAAILQDHRDHMAEDMFLSLDRGALTTTRHHPKARLHQDRMVAHRAAEVEEAAGAVEVEMGHLDHLDLRGRRDQTADRLAEAEAPQAQDHRATIRPTHMELCERQLKDSQE